MAGIRGKEGAGIGISSKEFISPERAALIKERDELVRNSRVSVKLGKRFDAGKEGDVLAADADGTLYVRMNRMVYTGQNQDTKEQLLTKNIPFLVNTARPGWGEYDDEDTVQNLKLPYPDIVIAGTGGMVYWRDHDGKLVTDDVHLAMLNEHRVSIRDKDGKVVSTEQFDPRVVIEATYPILTEYAHKGLTDVLIDPGPIGTKGEKGIDGLRLVAREMPYEDIRAMSGEMKEMLSGVKLQLSEITQYSTDELFSGWIHIIPAAGGKDRGLRYVLDTLASVTGNKITAHAIGDTTIDIPMLTMGTSADKGNYSVKQYAVANLPPHARKKLKLVSGSVANYGIQSTPHLHLEMLRGFGPDGVAEVVNSIS